METTKPGTEVKQNNMFTQAKFRYDKVEMDILSLMLFELKKLDFKQNQIELSLTMLERFADKELRKGHIIDALKRMMTKKATIQDNGNLKVIQLISAFNYVNQSRIIIEVPQMSLEYYRPGDNEFTLYQLHKSLAMTGKHSKKLYHLLSQYKNAGSWRTDITELKQKLGLIDESGKEKYRSYNGFISEAIQPAVDEINNSGCDITCKWGVSGKQGKRVIELTFYIYPQVVKNNYTHRSSEQYHKLTNYFKLSTYQADIVMLHVPVPQIEKTLYEVQGVRQDGLIKNLGGYTATVFKRKFNLPYNVAEKEADI